MAGQEVPTYYLDTALVYVRASFPSLSTPFLGHIFFYTHSHTLFQGISRFSVLHVLVSFFGTEMLPRVLSPNLYGSNSVSPYLSIRLKWFFFSAGGSPGVSDGKLSLLILSVFRQSLTLFNSRSTSTTTKPWRQCPWGVLYDVVRTRLEAPNTLKKWIAQAPFCNSLPFLLFRAIYICGSLIFHPFRSLADRHFKVKVGLLPVL
ncbi:hypothetical protein C8R45DRAFT_999525 [Mycena sanguinolenta]|nr:hypothetical protein C8R45DRAFT_999525 [Mycena sanguinolenta]